MKSVGVVIGAYSCLLVPSHLLSHTRLVSPGRGDMAQGFPELCGVSQGSPDNGAEERCKRDDCVSMGNNKCKSDVSSIARCKNSRDGDMSMCGRSSGGGMKKSMPCEE